MIIILNDKKIHKVLITKYIIENIVIKCGCQQDDIRGLFSINDILLWDTTRDYRKGYNIE